MSPPPADLALATAVSAALTARQRTLIEMATPRLYRWMAGWDAAAILAELHHRGIYAGEIAEFLATVPPELAGHPHAEMAAIAMRRLRPLPARSMLEEIMANIPEGPR